MEQNMSGQLCAPAYPLSAGIEKALPQNPGPPVPSVFPRNSPGFSLPTALKHLQSMVWNFLKVHK